MTALAWVLVVSCGLAALALAMTLWNLALYRRPGDAPAPAGASVSICIPARNEQDNLEACIRSLLAQTHRNIEVLVYNDHSTDRTGEILSRLAAEDPRVRAVPVEDLPEGWNGKQFACDRAGRAARSDWLLFTDADVRFGPACIERTLAAAASARADLVSTFPRQITGSLGEALVIPMIHVILLSFLPLARMRSSGDPAASAGCGQFLFVRREAWLAAGGHGQFRNSMHDGIMMPRTLRRAGFRTDLFDGTVDVSCRMYRGLAATWRGFAKNAYEGLGSLGLLVFLTIFNATAYLMPPAVLLLWGFGSDIDRTAAAGAGIALAIALAHRFILAVRFRQSVASALLHPLGVALMTAIQWRSWYLALTGRRTWRGRVHSAPSAA
ncbi:MAG: glycosyltransferase [Phycisphaerae bacterium]|nr:glycosyltransferase [Phycisphaerae bacterium]